MNQKLEVGAQILVVIGLAFFAVVFLKALFIKFCGFVYELEYINQRIRFATGEEQGYWKREKRRLWLSLLLFYRRQGRRLLSHCPKKSGN